MFDGAWAEDRRYCPSLVTVTPLGDVQACDWRKDVVGAGVCVRGSTVLIGQRFEDGLVKGACSSISLSLLPHLRHLTPTPPPPPGICVMMDMRESLCVVASIDERSPARITLSLPLPGSTSESSAGYSTAALLDPLV